MNTSVAARGLNRLGRWVALHHWLVLAAGALVAFPACLAAFSVRPVGNLAAMLSLNQPSAQALARITEEFRGMDELIVLAGAPQSLSPAQTIDQLYEFAERLRVAIEREPRLQGMLAGVHFEPPQDMQRYLREVVVPHIAYYVPPQSWPQFQQRFTPEGMRERFARLEALLGAPAAGGGAMAKAAMKDPLGIHEFVLDLMPSLAASGRNGFLAPDGRHLMIRIHGREPVANLDFAVQFTGLISEAAAAANSDGLQLRFTGPYAIAATSQTSIRRDMIFTITGSLIALQILFWFSYRELLTFPLVIAPVALGIIMAFAVAKLAGIPLTPMTAVIGGVLAGLGIDYCIHPLSRYRYERTLTADRGTAIGRTLAEVVPPNAAALVTTASGFLALSATSVQMVRSFGLIGVLGLAGCFLVCLFVFPAMLAAVPERSRMLTTKRATFVQLIEVILARGRLALGCCLALVALALGLVLLRPPAGIEGDLAALHPRPNPALEAQRELVEIFGAANEPWLIHLRAESEDGLGKLAHQVRQRLSLLQGEDSTIAGTFGLATLFPDPDYTAQRRGELLSWNVEEILGAFRSGLAQSPLDQAAFSEYENFIRDVLTANNPPTLEKLREFEQISALLLPKVSGNERHEAVTTVFFSRLMDDRAARDQAIAEMRSALAGVHGATLTGLTVVAHDLEEQIKSDLARSMWIADLLVIGSLLLYFRSLRLALLAAIPPTFAALLLYAGMQVFDIRLNLVNLVGLPLLIGIGVDNGVFLTSLIKHQDDQPLVERMGAAAHAITMTTLTTVLTFGSLLLTSTTAIRSLGLLMAIGVTSALVGALFLLCPLLASQGKSRSARLKAQTRGE